MSLQQYNYIFFVIDNTSIC